MRNLVKCLLAVTVLLTSPICHGQQMQKKTPEERAQSQVQWMQRNLAITDDQNKKAHDIVLHYARQADIVMDAQPTQRKQAMEQIQKDKDNELKGILTGDQYQKYEAHVREMQEKMKERRGGMPQGG
jgi:hypothetical protein